jgi:hypothetical protein
MVPMIRINIEDRLEVRISGDGIGFEPDNMSEEDYLLVNSVIQQVIHQWRDMLGLNCPPGIQAAPLRRLAASKPVTKKPAKPHKGTGR